ncbi:MAG TPA: SPFH domain-containing protein [Candidatus Izemoplasmatales bacterium]|nr:SPFH domain-containing protein [Bacillota bacterium]HRY77879.1 SPFH domain-containing protein [Candidatus Izemoplasmatales bacterium]
MSVIFSAIQDNPLDLLILGLFGALIVYLLTRFMIIPKNKSCVIERLGTYLRTCGPGIHYRLPFVDRLRKTIDFQGKTVHMIPTHQIIKTYAWPEVFTKDRVSVALSAKVNLQISDPRLYVYGASAPPILVERLMAQAIHGLFVQYEWGEILTDSSAIHYRLREFLQANVNPWGIHINRVDLGKMTPKDLSRPAVFH